MKTFRFFTTENNIYERGFTIQYTATVVQPGFHFEQFLIIQEIYEKIQNKKKVDANPFSLAEIIKKF